MRRILLGGLLVSILALASFAVPGPPQALPTPLSFQGLPLTRAFRVPVTLVGTGSGGLPQTMQMPPSGGVVITQVSQNGQSPDVFIAVNGVNERFNATGSGFTHTHDLNPPIIARPGDVLTLTPGVFTETVVIAGYTTLPGET